MALTLSTVTGLSFKVSGGRCRDTRTVAYDVDARVTSGVSDRFTFTLVKAPRCVACQRFWMHKTICIRLHFYKYDLFA